jgi:L-asparaginase II
MRMELEVVVRRGAIAESRHALEVAVVDADGRVVAATTHPDHQTTFRSSAKPFQLLPLVERGHAERWGFTDEQLAVMAASHTGSRRHMDVVSSILDRLHLGPAHLACGIHPPKDPSSLRGWEAQPQGRSTLSNNCSGKHAGMLALAKSEGWAIRGYERSGHPVQRLMRETIAQVTGVRAEDLVPVVDGCSVWSFALPLEAMARAFARASGAVPGGGSRDRALHRIRTAMMAHPDLVGGEGELSTILMKAAPGALLAKGGAEGVECVGVVARRWGIAIKCLDGASRALGPAMVALLKRLDVLDDKVLERLRETARPVLKNHAGLEVGTLKVHLQQPIEIPSV